MDKIKEIIDRVFKSEQEKRLMGAAVLVLIGLCIFIMAISPLVGASPIITLNGEEEMLVECGSEFVDPGVKATAKDEDISDGDDHRQCGYIKAWYLSCGVSAEIQETKSIQRAYR